MPEGFESCFLLLVLNGRILLFRQAADPEVWGACPTDRAFCTAFLHILEADIARA